MDENGTGCRPFDKARSAELAAYYRRHLLKDVMGFWEPRVIDARYGGYLLNFDREGRFKQDDTSKYMWLQARLLWMFSAIYNDIEKDEKWLVLARHGRKFILDRGYEGGGRWDYQLDRYGNVERGTVSIFADCFVLNALCEYAEASGCEEDIPLIRETFRQIEKRVYEDDLRDYVPYTWDPSVRKHAIHMVIVNLCGVAEKILGKSAVRAFAENSMEIITGFFIKDEYRTLFETLKADGGIIRQGEGRLINPGHIFESMWFCIEEAKKTKNYGIIKRCLDMIEWTHKRSHDSVNGGIRHYSDFEEGRIPDYTDWNRERNILWNDKVWWTQAEALYSLALLAAETGKDEHIGMFEGQHGFCRDHFYDDKFGEWYMIIGSDNTVKMSDKGGLQKTAFHIPRALLMLVKLFEGRAGK